MRRQRCATPGLAAGACCARLAAARMSAGEGPAVEPRTWSCQIPPHTPSPCDCALHLCLPPRPAPRRRSSRTTTPGSCPSTTTRPPRRSRRATSCDTPSCTAWGVRAGPPARLGSLGPARSPMPAYVFADLPWKMVAVRCPARLLAHAFLGGKEWRASQKISLPRPPFFVPTLLCPPRPLPRFGHRVLAGVERHAGGVGPGGAGGREGGGMFFCLFFVWAE